MGRAPLGAAVAAAEREGMVNEAAAGNAVLLLMDRMDSVQQMNVSALFLLYMGPLQPTYAPSAAL